MKNTLSKLIDEKEVGKLPILYSLVKGEHKSKKFFTEHKQKVFVDKNDSRCTTIRFYKPISKLRTNAK